MCQISYYRNNTLQHIWIVEAFDQTLQSMAWQLNPWTDWPALNCKPRCKFIPWWDSPILEDVHATEDQDQNDSDNDCDASISGYDGDISESDSNMSDISDCDSDMSYTSESDSNISEPNIESNISDSDNNSDTTLRFNPWDVEYLWLIQSAIDNLSVETVHQIRSSCIEHYISEAAWNEATRIFDNFHAEYLRIVHPDSDINDHNLEDSIEQELSRDLLIYLIMEQIPLEIRTVHKYSTKADRVNRDN